jgi:hypothetical protein
LRASAINTDYWRLFLLKEGFGKNCRGLSQQAFLRISPNLAALQKIAIV